MENSSLNILPNISFRASQKKMLDSMTRWGVNSSVNQTGVSFPVLIIDFSVASEPEKLNEMTGDHLRRIQPAYADMRASASDAYISINVHLL